MDLVWMFLIAVAVIWSGLFDQAPASERWVKRSYGSWGSSDSRERRRGRRS
jgi:hypothetical protein